ncbi:hypothetical protein [Blastococcus brunescens]|uniref:Uncharacterized protein n=1 Tax=Blastococcus brunescens TaxID=1564165 RepID=A0ABZ1AYT3_9ACTN|nr:hypothetical protein [Blastococcus sp. BMG 8361]WRL62808.1 hypothetical protein U6N30_23405 [Blastococcus sp. BMG 8361]
MRPLQASDAFLLRVATWLNLNWCRQRFTLAHVDADPHLAAYYRSPPTSGSCPPSGPSPLEWCG